MQIFTSGEVAKILGMPFYKLYYLERTGKISPARRTGTGRRYYCYEDIEMLREKLKKIKKYERKNI